MISKKYISVAAIFILTILLNACTGAGESSNNADNSGIDVTAPTKPQNLRTSTLLPTSVNITWDASTDNMAVAGYHIYKNDVLVTSTSATGYLDTQVTANSTYVYCVVAYDMAGNSTLSDTLSVSIPVSADTTAPIAPGNLRTTTITNTSISIAWNASTDNVGVAGYRVYRGSALATTTTSLTYTHSGLTAGTTYQLRVEAFDAANNSASSTTLNAATTGSAPDTLAPTAPGNLRSTAVSNSSISLAWNASTDNVAVTSYRIYRGGTQISQTTSTTYTDATVVAGTSYSYTVRAYDAAGNNTTSAALTITVPSAATANASLSWTPPTQNTDNSTLTNLTGYIVRYGLAQNNLNLSQPVGSGLTSIVIENLQSGVTYYFSITAINSLGVESDLSNIVSKTTS